MVNSGYEKDDDPSKPFLGRKEIRILPDVHETLLNSPANPDDPTGPTMADVIGEPSNLDYVPSDADDFEREWRIYTSWLNRNYGSMSSYQENLCRVSDIQEHLGLLHGLAKGRKVVELGFRTGVSTSAFLAAGSHVTSFDIDDGCKPYVRKLAREYPNTFVFKVGDSRKIDLPHCELLFIDTDHTYETTWIELNKHQGYARELIVLHDTETFGRKDRPPGTGKGIRTAIDHFLDQFENEPPFWKEILHLTNNNGLTILQAER